MLNIKMVRRVVIAIEKVRTGNCSLILASISEGAAENDMLIADWEGVYEVVMDDEDEDDDDGGCNVVAFDGPTEEHIVIRSSVGSRKRISGSAMGWWVERYSL